MNTYTGWMSKATFAVDQAAEAAGTKRVKRITSHVGLSRYMATLRDTNNTIPRTGLPSPYAYSPTHLVYRDVDDLLVFIVETAHKRYDVFRVPATSPLSPAEVI